MELRKEVWGFWGRFMGILIVYCLEENLGGHLHF